MSNEVKVIGGIVLVAVVIFAAIIIYGSTPSAMTPSTPKTETNPQLVRDYSPSTGPVEAPVTLVEFGDFQCPACGGTYPEIKQLQAEYGDRLRFVFRNYPLTSIHANAELAARAAVVANKYGKFWQMHDKLFETQNSWSSSLNPQSTFTSYAEALGIDGDQFKKELTNQSLVDQLAQDKGDGQALGVTATPTIYINGVKYSGSTDYAGLKNYIDSLLNQ